jgi:hypothetical protein
MCLVVSLTIPVSRINIRRWSYRGYGMFVIDQNVEIPGSRTRYPFPEMEPGDSIFFDTEKRAVSARVAAVRYAAKQNEGWRFTLRRVEGGWRLWRTD